jgi:hypothetical protein
MITNKKAKRLADSSPGVSDMMPRDITVESNPRVIPSKYL